ncbi:MAG: hypothetical protein MSC31_14720 [Solirubrobacteraceae bacterium MAG38_C4-C5]|nr:hypothetical protein [Candidatus Siliceabacter maunaloa]
MTAEILNGQRVRLEGDFPGIVCQEVLERDNGLAQVRVRPEDDTLEETWLSEQGLDQEVIEPLGAAGALVRGNELRITLTVQAERTTETLIARSTRTGCASTWTRTPT